MKIRRPPRASSVWDVLYILSPSNESSISWVLRIPSSHLSATSSNPPEMFLIGDPIRRHRPPQGGTGCHRLPNILAPQPSKIHGKQWKSMKNYGNACKSMEIYENLWKSTKINENRWKSIEKLWKSMKINENSKHIWDLFVLKLEDGLYSIF